MIEDGLHALSAHFLVKLQVFGLAGHGQLKLNDGVQIRRRGAAVSWSRHESLLPSQSRIARISSPLCDNQGGKVRGIDSRDCPRRDIPQRLPPIEKTRLLP